MSVALAPRPDPSAVLAEAFLNAGRTLGMTQAELGQVVGRDRSALSRGRLDPASKSGELALLFIRIHRALFALMGGDAALMRHWMSTDNRHTGGVPHEQIGTIQGLVQVLEYLDAMRGKL